MTIATSHSSAENKLDDFRQALGGLKEDHKMIFVTTNANLDSFQGCKNMKDIEQFVMSPEAVASPDVLKPRRKQKVSTQSDYGAALTSSVSRSNKRGRATKDPHPSHQATKKTKRQPPSSTETNSKKRRASPAGKRRPTQRK